MDIVDRKLYFPLIVRQFVVHPVCAILGPRQVGKTTLARLFSQQKYPDNAVFFDLENPIDIARLENPILALQSLLVQKKFIVIDEIQRRPELFPVLRVLVDAHPEAKILILGSASRELIQQSSETLAGRIGYIELAPFSLQEFTDQERLWVRGGFPRSFLADNDESSFLWREAYIKTFLERDIPNLGFSIPAQLVYRFWMMLCHYHGQVANISDLGRSLGQTDYTMRKYLDILVGTFMMRYLHPWFENVSKRQVKSPKVYFRDSGILFALLGLKTYEQLLHNPKLGAFWEGFALEEVIRASGARSEECFFWATQSGAELDLLLIQGGKRIGFKFKYADAPKITPSMKISIDDLRLDSLVVIYPGEQDFMLSDTIRACGLRTFLSSQK